MTERDLAPVPAPAPRWMRRVGVIGRPPVTSFRIRFDGEFRLRPNQRWMPLTARQYNRPDPIARVFAMRIRMAGIVPIAGDDRYIDGTGSMRGRLLRLVPVANGRGREFDLGELVTWLDDAVVLAPSMLLVASTTWCAVDDRHVDVSVTDGPNAVTARVELGADGLAVDFVRTDRWYAGTNNDPQLTRSNARSILDAWGAPATFMR